MDKHTYDAICLAMQLNLQASLNPPEFAKTTLNHGAIAGVMTGVVCTCHILAETLSELTGKPFAVILTDFGMPKHMIDIAIREWSAQKTREIVRSKLQTLRSEFEA